MPAAGFKLSEEAKEKIRQAKLGDKNPMRGGQAVFRERPMRGTKRYRAYNKGKIYTPYGCSVEQKIRNITKAANKRGIQWSLTVEEARDLLVKPCYYCGRVPALPKPGGIDRRNHLVGYHRDNCVPCCWPCNNAKGTNTEETFIELCQRVIQHQYHLSHT